MPSIDLSHTIKNGMPVFPGTETPTIEEVFSHEVHGFREHRLNIFSHVGTHIDAPDHMIAGGETLDSMDVNRFIGPGICIDCTHRNLSSPEINIDDLIPYEAEISKCDFILLNTGWYNNWGEQKYFTRYPALNAEAARWLIDFNLKGVGVDVISIDSAEISGFAVHNILLEQGTIIIENLNALHLLPDEGFIFSCLPLKFENADGSPVRAVATY
ncbi:cyclase family protein [Desulfovibrio sp. JC022]|uniref:cyclase family protein n=1 Tax=Desulfovibrio sp. JC022 TaxID=2593642 RepID=UPI0013D0DFDF|nr:cyclase family protein [Desulfovibrio sp. JC022]NDV21886.1 cyclase family protein [Desulfovibrio sp. JC022]